MSAADNHPGPIASAPSLFRRWRWYLLLCALSIGGLWLTSSRGGMGEFSPYSLQCRSRSEYTIVFGAIPIYRSRWHYWPNPLIEFLVSEGLVARMAPDEQRWEPLFHWNAWGSGESGLYSDVCFDKESTIEWCKKDRARAEFYWSELFRLLRSERRLDHQMADHIAGCSLRVNGITATALERLLAATEAGMLEIEIWRIEEDKVLISDVDRDRLERELAEAQRKAGDRSD